MRENEINKMDMWRRNRLVFGMSDKRDFVRKVIFVIFFLRYK